MSLLNIANPVFVGVEITDKDGTVLFDNMATLQAINKKGQWKY